MTLYDPEDTQSSVSLKPLAFNSSKLKIMKNYMIKKGKVEKVNKIIMIIMIIIEKKKKKKAGTLENAYYSRTKYTTFCT